MCTPLFRSTIVAAKMTAGARFLFLDFSQDPNGPPVDASRQPHPDDSQNHNLTPPLYIFAGARPDRTARTREAEREAGGA